MLAAKASVASRCDAFSGQLWSDEKVTEVEQRVEEIRATHQDPPPGKRR